jgi:hypothetical protein
MRGEVPKQPLIRGRDRSEPDNATIGQLLSGAAIIITGGFVSVFGR